MFPNIDILAGYSSKIKKVFDDFEKGITLYESYRNDFEKRIFLSNNKLNNKKTITQEEITNYFFEESVFLILLCEKLINDFLKISKIDNRGYIDGFNNIIKECEFKKNNIKNYSNHNIHNNTFKPFRCFSKKYNDIFQNSFKYRKIQLDIGDIIESGFDLEDFIFKKESEKLFRASANNVEFKCNKVNEHIENIMFEIIDM